MRIDELNYLEAFRLFIRACHLCLDDLPAHFHYAITGESIAHPDSKERWQQELGHLKDRTISTFAEAFAKLLEACKPLDEFGFDGIYGPDILGGVYMEMLSGRSNKWNYNAQYFTPWSVALMMAKMSSFDGDIEVEFFRQVRAAIESDPALQAMMLAAGLCGQLPEDNGEAFMWWVQKAWKFIKPHLKPVTFCEPAVGSGIMILAHAACHPLWLSQIGFIRYYGQDLDGLCVEMCRLNLRLYGIVPLGIEDVTWEALARLQSAKPDDQGVIEQYNEVLAAECAGDNLKRQEVVETINHTRLVQASLFESLVEGSQQGVMSAHRKQRQNLKPQRGITLNLFDKLDGGNKQNESI